MRERFTTWLLVALLAFLAQFSVLVAWFEPDEARASAAPGYAVCRVVSLSDRQLFQRPPPSVFLYS